MPFWSLLLIFFLFNWGFAYQKPIKIIPKRQDFVESFYLSLEKEKSLKWSLVPEDFSLKNFRLLPSQDYLLSVYSFEISYPLKSILYQSFLEYNLRYLLAEKAQKYLDYQKELETFKHFYQVAKETLGPYWQEIFAETYQSSTFKKDSLVMASLNDKDLETFFSKYYITQKKYSEPSFSSFSSGEGSISSFWRPQVRYSSDSSSKMKESYSEESEENLPGFFRKLLNFIFGIIGWIGKNKEILLFLYGFFLLIVFLFSAAKK